MSLADKEEHGPNPKGVAGPDMSHFPNGEDEQEEELGRERERERKEIGEREREKDPRREEREGYR